MQILNYLLYYLLLVPLSLLPMRLLYLISDFFFLLIWYVIPYRKKIVIQNLRNSFPEKSSDEINVIAKKFYRHFCDLVLESVKAFRISKTELTKRLAIRNPELLKSYYDRNMNLILVTSHYGNWEWGSMEFSNHSKHLTVGIFLPLKNKFWDRKIRQSRSRFGTHLISVREVARFFQEKHELFMCAFIGDQSPSNPRTSCWVHFLNQETAFLTGAEKMAREFNLPVLYGHVRRIKRGYYELGYTIISENSASTSEGEITATFAHTAEKFIREEPAYWLWTHRRWKHKRK